MAPPSVPAQRAQRRQPRALALLLLVAAAALLAGNAAFAALGRRAALASAASAVGIAAFDAPEAAQAKSPGATSDAWIGLYSDPMHPGCRREVVVDFAGVFIEGADGQPGCLKGEKLERWTLPATYTPGSDTLVIDFSPKGGPKDVKGTWDGNGIRFPDGNKWTRLSIR
mmetsp:Transcript_12332/g.28264  ORF Transcript_12332/g.28264 Transcript_12332/m.28264 type:complete len:169 (+) Transcript_12332:78-584(+)